MIPDSEKKSTTVRISKKDLLNLLSENERLNNRVIQLVFENDKLVEEINELRGEVNDVNCLTLPAEESHITDPGELSEFYGPGIYLDGSQGGLIK
jgi:hypothetical protein